VKGIEAKEILLFPQPQEITLDAKRVLLGTKERLKWRIVLGEKAAELERQASETVSEALKRFSGLKPEVVAPSQVKKSEKVIVIGTIKTNTMVKDLVKTKVDAPKNTDQAYLLKANRTVILLAGNEPIGAYYAAQTFIQLLSIEGSEIYAPEVLVRDWPEYRFRGIYVECRWGPEMMTLDDWKGAIDFLSSIKLNIMSVGVYNCWPIQYDGKLSEFLMVPIRKYPFLKAPKRIDYYSPKQGEWVKHEYLPTIFIEDLLDEIAAYGRNKGVIVRPHFNTPGHNTLIPRLIPEVSAKDTDGNPKGFGFCMTNPKTYEVMFNIFDEIIDRYLKPNGVDFFHIGADEVYPWVGADEKEPLRRVSPWCECPECRKIPEADRYLEYVLRLHKHLKNRGMKKVGMWYDSLQRGGKLNEETVRRFEKEGLRDTVVLHWWRYQDFFETIRPELGLTTWVTPMTGYFHWVKYLNHLENVFNALRVGFEQGTEGTEAYGVFDRSFHRNHYCLAEYSWNQNGTGDLEDFKKKYDKLLFGKNWRQAARAFRYLDGVVSTYGTSSLVESLFHYTYAYAFTPENAFIRANYPQAILNKLMDNPLRVLSLLHGVRTEMEKAVKIFSDPTPWTEMGLPYKDIYTIECERIRVVTKIFTQMATVLRDYRRMQKETELRKEDASKSLSNALKTLQDSLNDLDTVMLTIEKIRDHFVVPQTLRELSLMRRSLEKLKTELEQVDERVKKGTVTLPDLDSMKFEPIQWIG